MRTGILFILLIVLMQSKASAQNVFSKTFGGADLDGAMSVVQLPDNGYVVTGYTGSFGNNSDILAIRLDEMGNLLWLKTFGGQELEGSEKVLFHNDRLYFLGYSNSENPEKYDTYLVATDLDGNELWSQTFGGSDWEFGKEMIFVNDSILLVASESYSYGSFADVLLTYLNINTLETEEFVFLSPNNVQVIKLLVTESNKLLVVSNFNSEDGETRGFQIYKTDFFSNVAFENFVVPYTLQTEFRDATMANNGLIVVAGTFFPENNLYGETLATLIDTNGVFITDIKSPDNDNFAYPINAVKYLQNDVCIYAGASTFLNFNITRGAFYTSNGLIYYDDGRVFDGNVYDEFKDITSTSDGGFIAVGNSKTFGPGLFGALIVKINSELNFTLNVVTSIDEQISTEDNNFKIYPNPVSDILYFEHQLSTSIEKIRIFDVKGNLIQSINNNEATTIDVSQLTNGVYFISFETKDKQILIRKFIKK